MKKTLTNKTLLLSVPFFLFAGLSGVAADAGGAAIAPPVENVATTEVKKDFVGGKVSFINNGFLTVPGGHLANVIKLKRSPTTGTAHWPLLGNITEKFIRGNFREFIRVVTDQEVVLTRVHRHVNDTMTEKARSDIVVGEFGSYLGPYMFKNIEKTQDNLALLSSWYAADSGLAMWSEIIVPAGTEMYVGGVSPQADAKEYRPGGNKLQFYVPKMTEGGNVQLSLANVHITYEIKEQYK